MSKTYIELDAALDLAYWHGEHCSYDNLNADGTNAVDAFDLLQMPPFSIVTCEHCEHSWVSGGGYRFCDRLQSKGDRRNMMVDDDDFCAWGSTKEDDGE